MFGGEGSDYYKQLMDGVTVDEGHIMHILTQRDGVLPRTTALYSCGSTPVQSLRRPVRSICAVPPQPHAACATIRLATACGKICVAWAYMLTTASALGHLCRRALVS